jgi:hypothetical protein
MKNVKRFKRYFINEAVKQFEIDESVDYKIVYRGQPDNSTNISPNNHIWVTYDIDFARIYGIVNSFEMPNTLNILYSIDDYTTWEELIDEFEFGGDYDEYKYEPSNAFIYFLKSKGYDGFENGENILIFNRDKLIYK